MKSESVWHEQVCDGLIDYIQSLIIFEKTGIDENGEDVIIKTPVPVTVRKPDEDFKIGEVPCVTLQWIHSSFAPERFDVDKVAVDVDKETGIALLEDSAQPFNLFYQIDFWSDSHIDMDFMTRKWLWKNARDFVLPVFDMSGNRRYCHCVSMDSLVSLDALKDKNQKYHSCLSYRIYVELDEKDGENKYIVLSNNVDLGK